MTFFKVKTTSDFLAECRHENLVSEFSVNIVYTEFIAFIKAMRNLFRKYRLTCTQNE